MMAASRSAAASAPRSLSSGGAGRSASPLRRHPGETAAPIGVRKNEKGGVYVADAEVDAAFRWLTKGKDKLTLRDLKARLSPFYPDMPLAELKFLMGDKTELSPADIKSLLKDNTITNFDPVAEAFSVFDVGGTGAADVDFISSVLLGLGFERITEDDRAVIMKSADVDGDGRISEDDFRRMLARSMKGSEHSRSSNQLEGGDDDGTGVRD